MSGDPGLQGAVTGLVIAGIIAVLFAALNKPDRKDETVDDEGRDGDPK